MHITAFDLDDNFPLPNIMHFLFHQLYLTRFQEILLF
jgi:hypothetical protein